MSKVAVSSKFSMARDLVDDTRRRLAEAIKTHDDAYGNVGSQFEMLATAADNILKVMAEEAWREFQYHKGWEEEKERKAK